MRTNEDRGNENKGYNEDNEHNECNVQRHIGHQTVNVQPHKGAILR